ncbi:hypothetical protein M433DRAFT_160060 [Acidomyces richmondensis BFW]|nr:MAG: hypothetical protein FE78DRAFT_89627 [Acidomyces sp. 'richmondensis']KYG40689.1 hypothetical protein M433DRAFT_160060 [Acidomyces richmondensis BFW]
MDSVDELVEHFRALRLSAVQLGPVVQAARISSVVFTTIVARASILATVDTITTTPRYSTSNQQGSV